MNRHLSMTTTLAGVALASLAIVYGLVFYDGRSKAERINDCAKKAGYATTVTVDPGHNGSWSDMSGNSAAPTFTPPSPPSTTVTVYASPADSPFLPRPQDDHVWWMRVNVAESTTTSDSALVSPRDRAAILNCTS